MFANRLRAVRIYRKYTQQQLAEAIDIAPRTYQRYEEGTRQPDYVLLLEIAKFLDISIDFLLGNDEYLQKMGWQIDMPLDVPPRKEQKNSKKALPD